MNQLRTDLVAYLINRSRDLGVPAHEAVLCSRWADMVHRDDELEGRVAALSDAVQRFPKSTAPSTKS